MKLAWTLFAIWCAVILWRRRKPRSRYANGFVPRDDEELALCQFIHSVTSEPILSIRYTPHTGHTCTDPERPEDRVPWVEDFNCHAKVTTGFQSGPLCGGGHEFAIEKDGNLYKVVSSVCWRS